MTTTISIVKAIIGDNHPEEDEVLYLMEGLVKSLIFTGQGVIVSLMEDANLSDDEATALLNTMLSHFAASTPKTGH